MKLLKKNTQKGMASSLVLVASIPLLVVGGALLKIVVSHKEEESQLRGQETAQLISFAGAQQALANLDNDELFEGPFEFEMNGGIAAVTVTSWADDGIDNDQDGWIDDDDEVDFRSITSEGWMNGVRDIDGLLVPGPGKSSRAETFVIANKIDLDFNFQQTIYIDDPAAEIDLNGGAFILSGNDTNVDGSAGSEDSRPAIGVGGDPAGILAQIANNQKAQIIGSLPDPAIGETDPLDAQHFADIIAPMATISYDEDTSYSGTLGNLKTLEGEIVYAAQDLKLHGKTSGAGIMYVDGDLYISGRFQYAGVIIVRGSITFSGGGGAKELQGSLLVWGESESGQDGEGAEDPDLGINGTVQVEYSSEALNAASRLVGFEVSYWQER